MHAIRFLLALVVAALPYTSSPADAYPTKPVRFVVTFPPGGPTDTIVRLIGQRLTDLWGHPMILDNRGGAGGIVGTEIVARAAPDGYSFLVGTAGGSASRTALRIEIARGTSRSMWPPRALFLIFLTGHA